MLRERWRHDDYLCQREAFIKDQVLHSDLAAAAGGRCTHCEKAKNHKTKLNPQARLDCGVPLPIRLFICHSRRI